MSLNKNNKNINYNIIEETDDFLVVYKSPGLIVHSGRGVKETALSDLLLLKYPEIKDVGEDSDRPGIVHRLDKEVGGLLLVAKNNKSFFFFKDQFKKRKINKEYTALVFGQIINDFDTINFPIARSKKTGKMAALPLSSKNKEKLSNRDKGNIKSLMASKEAQTTFTVLKRFVNYSLLKIQISTGRTHQIRVHMGAYGHPIVGDDVYGNKKCREKNKKINLERVFLEANKLSFTYLDKKTYSYELDLPEDLENFLNNLN